MASYFTFLESIQDIPTKTNINVMYEQLLKYGATIKPDKIERTINNFLKCKYFEMPEAQFLFAIRGQIPDNIKLLCETFNSLPTPPPDLIPFITHLLNHKFQDIHEIRLYFLNNGTFTNYDSYEIKRTKYYQIILTTFFTITDITKQKEQLIKYEIERTNREIYNTYHQNQLKIQKNKRINKRPPKYMLCTRYELVCYIDGKIKNKINISDIRNCASYRIAKTLINSYIKTYTYIYETIPKKIFEEYYDIVISTLQYYRTNATYPYIACKKNEVLTFYMLGAFGKLEILSTAHTSYNVNTFVFFDICNRIRYENISGNVMDHIKSSYKYRNYKMKNETLFKIVGKRIDNGNGYAD